MPAGAPLVSILPLKYDPDGNVVPRVLDIQRAACRYFGIRLSELLSRRREKEIVMVRHIAIYVAFKLTFKSCLEISQAFKLWDHSSAIHAKEKIGALLDTDDAVRAAVAAIMKDAQEVIFVPQFLPHRAAPVEAAP